MNASNMAPRMLGMVGLMAAAILLSACAVAQPTTRSPQPAPVATPSPAPAQPPVTLDIYSASEPWTVSYGLGYSIMHSTMKEFLTKNNIREARINNLAFDQAATAIQSGAANIYFSSGISSIAAALKPGFKSNVRIIAGLATKPVYQIIAQPDLATVESLRGKNGGVPGIATASGEVTRMVLLSKGMKFPGDYNLLLVGNSGLRLAALKSKAIDFEADLAPSTYIAIADGFKIVADAKDYMPNYATGVILVNNSYGNANREAIVGYLKGMLEATKWAVDNKEKAIEMLATQYKVGGKPIGTDYATRLYDEMVTEQRLAFDLYTPKASVQGNLDSLRLSSDISEDLVNELWSLFDWSYLKQALSELNMPVPPEIR